jgi:hypothetical protein
MPRRRSELRSCAPKSRSMTSQPIRPTGRVTSWDSVKSLPSPSGSTSNDQTGVPAKLGRNPASLEGGDPYRVGYRNACAECSASGSACATPTCCGSTASGNVAVAADVPRSAGRLIWNITRRSPRAWLRSLSSMGSGPQCLVRTPHYTRTSSHKLTFRASSQPNVRRRANSLTVSTKRRRSPAIHLTQSLSCATWRHQ